MALVAGAAGIIGDAVMRELGGNGWKVRGLSRRRLRDHDLDQLVGWGFGDFIFNTETDVISDVNQIYEHGFTERMDSTASLLRAIDRLKRQRVLP